MLKKYHVNEDTGKIGICRAQPGTCPVGPHTDKGVEAQAISDKILSDLFEPLKGVKRQPRSEVVASRKHVDYTTGEFAGNKMSHREADYQQKIASMASNFVDLRADLGDVVAVQSKGDPERARETLQNSIKFAAVRKNTALIEKLAKSKAEPTSVIMTRNGEKIYADDLSDADRAFKHLEDGRDAIQFALNRVALDAEPGVYNASVNGVNVKVSVSDDAVDDVEFSKLSPELRKQLSTPYSALSIELARDFLSDDEFSAVVKETKALDYVNGRPRDIGLNNVPVRTELKGDDGSAKVKDGAMAIAEMYSDSRKQFGASQKALKERRNIMASAVKESASRNGDRYNTFIPGRSRYNGLVVSGRQMIDADKARSILSDEKIAAITKTTFRPNVKKAKQILPAEIFEKVFSKRKVSVRVVED